MAFKEFRKLKVCEQSVYKYKATPPLIYAHADTEKKRRALENAVPENDPLKEVLNPERYTVDDEDLLKQLCGLK